MDGPRCANAAPSSTGTSAAARATTTGAGRAMGRSTSAAASAEQADFAWASCREERTDAGSV
eukprot:3634905-Alexandrium_andersonii.AAC.1